ncbi:hypothetical protein SAMD00019534_047700 [Acytostelium subglobosum LB1]|uniref:hypothetical protein n=1 Tax=Acytostelium subglobosum LB1 TaxID=1410327 RepID=UPI000644E4F9|nr:hypothetical protein SAMD00019534_047700 [Acytostelium subglobosum LB1]GAM21595.1 hypothetical protein SAMD00019534_047700 [Acytostelium subglobosum LB1]|eukprot:XP_012755714.1 hypothetical protein SAMD00019534_047700 [Acytostelium subglobosum LB1]
MQASKCAVVMLLMLVALLSNMATNAQTYPPAIPKDKFKMAVILSGDFTDLGYNYICNQALINVQRKFQLFNQTKIITNIFTPEGTEAVIHELVAENYTLIVGASLEHSVGTKAMAIKYPNVYFLIRDIEMPTIPNVRSIFIDFGIGHYMCGVMAALTTRSNKIGIVIPGPPSLGYITSNSFYLGARNVSNDVKVYLIESGSWLNPDLEAGATNQLLDLGVDVFAMSADDLTVQKTAAARGATSFCTSGYPCYNILGESILTSILYNWTNSYHDAAFDLLNGTWTPKLVYGTLADGSLEFDTQYSYLLAPSIIKRLRDSMEYWKQFPLEDLPYASNPIFFETYGKTRLSPYDLLKSEKYLNGTTYMGRYEVPAIEFKVSESVVIVFVVCGALLAFITMVYLAGVAFFRQTKIMRSASPLFCMMILVGALIVAAAIIIWNMNATRDVCRARLWLLSLGYTVIVGNMVIKNFRIWLIFDNPRLKRLKITNIKLLPWVLGMILVNLALLIPITIVGHVNAIRSYDFDGVGIYNYRMTCDMTKDGSVILYVLLAYHGLMLLIGCFVSWKIRTVDVPEFNESKPIANTIYAIAFCLFIIIPLMVSRQSYDGQNIIICASSVFVTGSAVLILFTPKFWRLYTKGVNANPFSKSTTSLSFGPSANTRELDTTAGVSMDQYSATQQNSHTPPPPVAVSQDTEAS